MTRDSQESKFKFFIFLSGVIRMKEKLEFKDIVREVIALLTDRDVESVTDNEINEMIWNVADTVDATLFVLARIWG